MKRLYFKFVHRFFFNVSASVRYLIGHSDTFYRLKGLNDLHKNERVFIVATGPSLTSEYLNKLKHEVTISMNSIALLVDELNWEPTYYVVQDFEIFHRLKDAIFNLKKSKVLIGHNVSWKYSFPEKFVQFPIDFLGHLHSDYSTLNTRFSKNAFVRVFDGYTVGYSCLQLAYFMGFSEIYLVGFDANYQSDYLKNNIVPSGKKDPTYKLAGRRINFAFDVAAKVIMDDKKVKVWNATRGGHLNSFERVNLDSIL